MSAGFPQIILASASPRRRELLAEAGYDYVVTPPRDTAESGLVGGETPAELVMRLAHQKSADVAGRCREGLVLGCDTVVECCGQILGKPDDARHAREMLCLLRGHEHHVYSGLCLWHVPTGRQWVRVAVTRLVMMPISDEQVEQYLASGDWQGKAGAFGYQDGHDWLQILEGSESNVVGLPLELLADMLEDVGELGWGVRE
jgi:septum formation protein